ncbi:GIY-YIG nuclease family protein [Anaerosphaera multitolerans]|uniref:GIY-YIG nuclease family protein n=1 Tax=Anaerosphaera multitolerans TaxID=2487351 RepID=UPI00196ADA94|nr:GIY-YIG nuclease family protein [Anaerosphaera multitolerans]
MKEDRKKLIEEYKNRKPEMGIISLKCKETGESFLDISKDLKVAFNGILIRLKGNLHPNKKLQSLWNEYGESGFDLDILKVLKYENVGEDHSDELEIMLMESLDEDSKAMRLWK